MSRVLGTWFFPGLTWVTFGALLAAAALLHPLGEPHSSQAVCAAGLAAAFLAGWACMVVSGRPGTGGTQARAGWSIAGTGAFLLAISQGADLVKAFGLSRSPAVEACATISYLAAHPAFLVGTVMLAFEHGR